jgi:hypothetical protein
MATAYQVKDFESYYSTLVKQAATDLQAALRQCATDSGLTVWAIPTYGNEPGRVIVAHCLPPELYERGARYLPRVIRPSDNRASRYTSWGWVPYSEQFHVLWHALRREPILPIVEA